MRVLQYRNVDNEHLEHNVDNGLQKLLIMCNRVIVFYVLQINIINVTIALPSFIEETHKSTNYTVAEFKLSCLLLP